MCLQLPFKKCSTTYAADRHGCRRRVWSSATAGPTTHASVAVGDVGGRICIWLQYEFQMSELQFEFRHSELLLEFRHSELEPQR